jgi:hypothetical protein
MSEDLLELIHLTRVDKYSQSDPKQVLLTIIEEIRMKTGHYGFRSWEIMVECLAKWLVLNEKTGLASNAPLQGFKGLDLKKDSLYTYLEGLDYFNNYYVAAEAKPWDYIGEVYVELGCVGMGQNMTPRAIVEFMTKCVYPEKMLDGVDELFCYDSYNRYVEWYYQTYHVHPYHLKRMDPPIKTQLDPCVGSGRFLIVASEMMPKANLVLFGIEINLALYRACLVNMAMFSNHPYSIICADTLMIDPKWSSPAAKIWDLGNQWNPPNMSSFYWKPQPPPPINPKSFSLQHFAEEIKDENK